MLQPYRRMLRVSALCDVNVLLALLTDRHMHHDRASRWADRLLAGEAVVCRVGQLGCLAS